MTPHFIHPFRENEEKEGLVPKTGSRNRSIWVPRQTLRPFFDEFRPEKKKKKLGSGCTAWPAQTVPASRNAFLTKESASSNMRWSAFMVVCLCT